MYESHIKGVRKPDGPLPAMDDLIYNTESQAVSKIIHAVLLQVGFLSDCGLDVCVAVAAPKRVQFWSSRTWRADLTDAMRDAANHQADLDKNNNNLDMFVKMKSSQTATRLDQMHQDNPADTRPTPRHDVKPGYQTSEARATVEENMKADELVNVDRIITAADNDTCMDEDVSPAFVISLHDVLPEDPTTEQYVIEEENIKSEPTDADLVENEVDRGSNCTEGGAVQRSQELCVGRNTGDKSHCCKLCDSGLTNCRLRPATCSLSPLKCNCSPINPSMSRTVSVTADSSMREPGEAIQSSSRKRFRPSELLRGSTSGTSMNPQIHMTLDAITHSRPICVNEEILEDMLKQQRDDFKKVHAMVSEQSDLLKTYMASQESVSGRSSCTLPYLQTVEQVMLLSPTREERDSMIAAIMRIGGENISSAIRLALRKLISTAAQSQLNMKGCRSGKRAFETTPLYSILRDAMVQQFGDVTDKQIKERVGAYLRYAPARFQAELRKPIPGDKYNL